MAVTNFPQVINGTYDLYDVPLTTNAPDEGNKVSLGCLKEGFTLNWSTSIGDVKTDCTGESIIDGIYKGIESATISMIVHEWDSQRTAAEKLIWPLNEISGAEFGDLEGIGKMVSYSNIGRTLMAVPRAGTPAAVNTAAWYFYCTHMKGGEDFNANFNVEDQVVPITLACYPVATEDLVTGNKIYFADQDTSQIVNFSSLYTLRYWRRKAV